MEGLDVRSLPGTEAYLQAVKKQGAVLTRDIFKIKRADFVPGGSDAWAMVMYAPFTIGEDFKGFVGSMFNMGAYFGEVQKAFPNLHIRVCANGALVYESHSESLDTTHPQYWFEETTIGNTAFQIEATPTPEYAATMSSNLSNVVLGFGLVLTLLISWLAHKNSVILHTDRLLKRQALALSQSSDGMMIFDNDRRLVGLNEATTKLFGYSEAEFLSMKTVELADSVIDREQISRERQASMDLDYTWRDVVPCRTKEGGLIHVSISETRLDDEHGKPMGTISMVRNVTNEVERNAKLRVSEKRFRRLF